MSEKQLAAAIREIIARGNNAEVKKRKDGGLAVYEVKKKNRGGSVERYHAGLLSLKAWLDSRVRNW